MTEDLVVRPMRKSDIAEAVSLQSACFPPPFPQDLLWKAEHLDMHLTLFPEGQFVATVGGAIIASASSCIVSETRWEARQSWSDTVGGPFIGNHDPKGTTMYGLDISVHPDWRKGGVGRRLYEARFTAVHQLALKRFGTACRLPGYRDHAPALSQEAYVELVSSGKIKDPALSPLLRYGLAVLGVIHGYMDDPESGDAAALLEWLP